MSCVTVECSIELLLLYLRFGFLATGSKLRSVSEREVVGPSQMIAIGDSQMPDSIIGPDPLAGFDIAPQNVSVALVYPGLWQGPLPPGMKSNGY